MLIGNSDNKENTNLNSVKDVTSENFMEEVVELSKSTPVYILPLRENCISSSISM